jgi:hypothetical protein
MSKAIVFISHITPERDIAIAFKDLIEMSFLTLIEVFVSSDEDSIGMGQRWLDNITTALQTCSIEIVLCSPLSVNRPWINFEAGAGWVRNIPVIPLCHSGLEPSKLPLPLNLLQAATANEGASLAKIFPVLAKALGSATPKVDFTDFIARVTQFERNYLFWDACNDAFGKLNAINPDIIPALKSGKSIKAQLSETQLAKLEEFMPVLTGFSLLGLRREGGMIMTTNGNFFPCNLLPLTKLAETLKDPRFKF